MTEGSDRIGTLNFAPLSYRKWYKNGSGHLFTEHSCMGMTDVCAAILHGLAFTPVFHVHCAESVLPLDGGLPQFRDMPTEVGRPGETVPQ